jgi:uncharacterized membrane protein YecN with MAPEG domain
MNPLLLPAGITLLNLLLLFGCAWSVGRARGLYKVKAPATTGHDVFERHYRVQANTVENTVIFLPALWLAALLFSAPWAAAAGAAWIAGRLWYALAYVADPARRGGGFTLAFVAWAALMAMAAWGVLRGLLA